MRILAIDYGEKRIGLAISDSLDITAQPLGVIERTSDKQAIKSIRERTQDYEIAHLIVGHPVHMNGSEGESARAACKFSDALCHAFNLPVTLWDERLTTAEAEKAMKQTGLSRKKRIPKLDTTAAQILLQSYLDQI